MSRSSMSNAAFYSELVQLLKTQGIDKDKITAQKVSLCRKYGMPSIPSDVQVLLHASPEELKDLQLVSKPMRTQSGVAPIAVMTAPSRCPHGKCTFCPGGINSFFGTVPQSYTGHEPATLRGMRNDYESFLQVMNRLEQYTVLGHSAEKAEIIVMGGTFPATSPEYQEEFITGIFQGLNIFGLFFSEGILDFERFKSFFELPGSPADKARVKCIKQRLREMRSPTTLAHEQELNETAQIRCVGLCIETKPDWGFAEHGNRMLLQGCTRIELGVESVYDEVLLKTHRGHTMADTVQSMRELKDLGFKITAHYMPGLPLTNHDRDLAGMKQLFEKSDLRPDSLKLYPTMVSEGTGLWQEWKAGKFTPLTTEQAASLIAEFKPQVPTYCRIMRVQRDVPTKWWSAGVGLTNLRQVVSEKLKANCRCIRCREPHGRTDVLKIKILVQEYTASEGIEFFISAEDVKKDVIVGFCRLRFPSQCLRAEITDGTAIVRELHVYGVAAPLGSEGEVQHHGHGRQLLARAEEIARSRGKNKIVVISGVGVREYYAKQGYVRDGPYMSKGL